MPEEVQVNIHYPDGIASDGFMAKEALPKVGERFVSNGRTYRVRGLVAAKNAEGATPDDLDWMDYELYLEEP